MTAEWVLTGDPLVTELPHAYFGAREAIIGGDSAGTMRGLLGEALPDERMGLLRVGEEFRVVAVSDEGPSAEGFAPPAEPVDFGGLLQGRPVK